MPIYTNQPKTVNGVTYDRLGVNLSISPAWKEKDVGPNVAIRFTPYTKDAEGNVLQLENIRSEDGSYVDYSSSFVYSGALMDDPDVEATVRELMYAVAKLISIKAL